MAASISPTHHSTGLREKPRRRLNYTLCCNQLTSALMAKKLSLEAKEKIVGLAGACFWYWNGYYSFRDSCGVPQSLQQAVMGSAWN